MNDAEMSADLDREFAALESQVAQATLDQSFAYEEASQRTKDHAEAVHAFLEGRQPRFVGE